MASDNIACRILIQNEQLKQVATFPHIRFLIAADGECTTEFCTRLNRGQAITAENMENSWPILMTIRLFFESAGVACSNVQL